MQFTDSVTVAGTRRRDDGYLVADARVARTGVQTYAGWEVGKPQMPVVRVYRPPDEVFSRDAMASFAHRPITNDHPDEDVTADNWKELAVGQSGDEVARDGTFLRIPLMVADGKMISGIEGGKRQLSAGYMATLDWTAGKTADGEHYDAIQRNIRANHIAVVHQGRAGSEVRIGDDANKWGAAPITPTMDKETITMSDALRTVVVDGLSVSTTDQGAQAIDKLQKDAAALQTKLSDAETAHKKALDAKDTELAEKDAKIADLEKKVIDAAALDALVQARADLVGKAKALAPDVKTEGVADADIRKAVVIAKRGEDAVKDRSAAYIDAAFDFIAEDAGKGDGDQVRDALKGGLKAADANGAWSDSVFAAAGVQTKKEA